MDAVARPHILVQGTADWHQPIATNQHYMVRELAREFEVTFVESLGLRKPEINVSDIVRIFRRLAGMQRGHFGLRGTPQNVHVISPKVVPNHRTPWRHLNSHLLQRYVRNWANSENRVYWTYSPVTYGYESLGRVAVYHCVDLYGSFPGIDAALIDSEERRLARKGVVAVGSSEVVVQHLRSQGFESVHYWPNVADTEELKKALPKADAPRSGVIFAGNLTEKKVDFDVLKQLVADGVELHLAGPVAQGGGSSQARLDDLIAGGAKYHGMLSLTELSHVMVKCKAGLIPYLITPYTVGVSPLKTFEYMAAGLSVVSTGLPGVEEREPHVLVGQSSESFVALTKQQASAPAGDVEERARIADAHSWAGRGEAARAMIRDLLFGAHGSNS